ncbi:MAG TPA: hypothetical protein VGS07_01110 [Thermoanaerobaculia bacterium]|jgi:hypothetical protein|nr:hypothetical protein [Thermoanaerobaculia bacterium]
MGLPQPLIDVLRDVEQAEKFNPEEAIREGTEAGLQKWLSGFRETVLNLEKSNARVRESGRVLLRTAKEGISSDSDSAELDRVIDWLLEREEESRRLLPLEIRMVQTLKAGTFSFPITASDKALLVSACERFIKVRQGIPENLRDLRWNLMAFRAESEDPGDAPVFDNPQDLLSYLKTPSR